MSFAGIETDGSMGTAPAGIACITAVSWTYSACTRESLWAVSIMALCSFTPASASDVANALRNECQSTFFVDGVSLSATNFPERVSVTIFTGIVDGAASAAAKAREMRVHPASSNDTPWAVPDVEDRRRRVSTLR